MAREPSKTRKWEKERRDRLNEAFNNLSKRLPCYNPSVTIVKIDILTKAAEYIKELEEKVNALVSSNPEKNQTENDYLKKLQDRIKKLLIRNEQLCNLLKDAKISIPSVSGTVKKFKTPHLWSNRINAEQAKLLQKEEVEKKINCGTPRKTSKRKPKISSTSIAPKHRKSLVIKTNDNKVKPLRKKVKHTKNLNSTTSNCVIVISQASVTHPCYIISSTPANSNAQTKTTTVTTNPTVVSAPVVSRTVKPSVLTGTNSSLSTLGPGTLILANGAILPVLPPTPSIVPVAPTLISNNVNTSLIMVSNISTSQINSNTISQISTVKTVERKRDITVCKPVRPKICLTRTTQVNKVPIPALTSRYANNYIILSNTQKPNTTKGKIKVLKKIRSVKVEKKTGEAKTDTEECLKRKLQDSEEAITKKAKTDLDDSDASKINTEIRNDQVDIQDQADVTDGKKVTVNGSGSKTNLGITQVTSSETEKSSETNTAVGIQESIHGADMRELKNEVTTKNSEIPEIDLPQKESVVEDTDVKSVHEEVDQSSIIPDISEATENEMKTLEINLPQSELSNDFLASLQVPAGCQNPESTSPTAAFLLTFPLVSSLNGVKVTEVIDEDNTESQRETPNLLQIGTMVNTKTTTSQSEALTPSLLNLDSFSFFTGKEFNNSFCNNFTTVSSSITTSTSTVVVTSTATFSNSNTMTVNKKVSDTSTNMDTQDRRKMDLINQKHAFNADKNKSVVNVLETKIIPTSAAVNIHDSTHNSSTYIKPSIQNMPKPAEKIIYEPTHDKGYTNSHVPVSFPNPPEQLSHESNITDIKTTAICTYASVSKSYCNSVNAQNNYTGYNYNTNNNYNQNYFNKNMNKVDNRSSYYSLPNYENYSEYKKSDIFNSNFYNSANAPKDNKYNTTVKSKPSQSQSKAPINWMTAPDNRLQTSDYLLPSLTKENEFSHNTMYPPTSFVCNTQTTYFNTNSMYSTSDMCNTMDSRKTLDLTIHNPISNNFQRTDLEEWSPTKMPQFLDPLVGDLGLTNNIFSEPKHDSKYSKERLKDSKRPKPTNYENQTNFLSVSQLVDNNSKNETIPARTTVRRNSGNRSKNLHQATNNKPKRKSQDNKDFSNYNIKPDLISKHNQVKNNTSYGTPNQNDIFCENKVKNSSSNYSAEALIGHSNHTVQADLTKRQNYTNAPKPPLPVPPFLTDNIIPYFPPVEFPQDNNYMQQNQNYNSNNFTHNFSTFQNNAYTANSFMPSVSTITSTYIPTNNFVHETHDFMVDNFNLFPNTNKDKPTGKNQIKHPNPNVKEEKNVNYCKKQKKKTTNESNFPGFDIQYLSLPGSRNSPLLPDDFHTHTNFLPPATSYKITNPLYHKPNSEIAPSTLLPIPPPVPGNRSGNQPEISPSINTSGSSLTNFNLSTIFPEITKGPLPDLYRDTRTKEATSSRNYNVTSSSLQVPFQNKSTFNFSYSQ